MEKLKTLINYFCRITKEMPKGVISFSRHSVTKMENFKDIGYTNVKIEPSGLIENEGREYVQVDFANKRIGGGVLGRGCIQEEIRFLIYPELIISKMICDEMTDNECIVITGAERFADYTGYASEYKFKGDHHDKTKYDRLKRKMSQIVAMDAMQYKMPSDRCSIYIYIKIYMNTYIYIYEYRYIYIYEYLKLITYVYERRVLLGLGSFYLIFEVNLLNQFFSKI